MERSEHPALDPWDVADRIGVPVPAWRGSCLAIATRMVEVGVVAGRARYGKWWGDIALDSIFAGHPMPSHGWIETADGLIVDPTRWVFESNDPNDAYIHVGPATDAAYDAGGNRLRSNTPCPPSPPDDERYELKVGRVVRDLALTMMGHRRGTYLYDPGVLIVTKTEAFWLANLTPDALGPAGLPIFKALESVGLKAFVPIDNWQLVVEDVEADFARKGKRGAA